MKHARIFFGWSLVALDVCLGLCLMFWPGAWHELLHGALERTTFFALHAAGVMFLTRAIAVAMLRSTTLGLGLYFSTVPAALYLAWSTASTSVWSAPVYFGLGCIWSLGAWSRWSQSQSPSEAEPDSTGVDFT